MHSITRKRRLAAAVTCSALALGVSAGPSSAATQRGLVNVDVANNTVQVPVGVAANICDVGVGVISGGTFDGNSTCDAISTPTANGGGGGGGAGSNQQGLVNVSLTGNTVQIPIGIAANVCDVDVNVITQNTFDGNSACTAITRPSAKQ